MVLLKQLKPTCLQLISALMFSAIMGQSNAVTIPNTFTAGTPATAAQVNANFTAVKDAIDTLQISNYTQFGSLNWNTITASTTAAKLVTTNGSHTFNKVNANTKIEVTVNSRLSAGAFAGGASGVQFEIRVDDTVVPAVGNAGAITTSGGTEFISMYAVFTGLAAGSHTVSVWAKTYAGTSTGVMADPGGWGGKIIVKEVR